MIQADRSPDYLVFALRPDSVLYDAVRRAKSKTLLVAGDQTYLSHPPHLTLYVAAFFPEAQAAIMDRVRSLALQDTLPPLQVIGWHHFSGDVLTGKQTLVCELNEASKDRLRQFQTRLIEALSDLRDPAASEARYRPHFSSLTAKRQEAVIRYGYPFISGDWIPHVTIASVAPNRWDAVWHALQHDAPVGEHTAEAISIFRLVNDYPTDWQTIPLAY